MSEESTRELRDAYYESLATRYVLEANRFVPGYSEEMIPSLLNALPALLSGVVADLGCGPGTISLAAYRQLAPVKMYMVDASLPMTEEAKRLVEHEELQNAEVRCEDVEAFAPPMLCDVVYASLVLHNVPYERKKAVLERLHGYLQPGGTFIWADLIRFNDSERQAAEVEYRTRYALERGADPAFVQENFEKEGEKDFPLEADAMVHMLEEVGFADITVVWERTTFATIRAIKK
jgi:tRNA (cmo5U34)-methyltransferase